MSDVVVTVPKRFGLDAWIAEGDAAGEPWSGVEWCFTTGGSTPRIQPGERVYVVYNNRLRGYAPLIRLERDGGALRLIRGGGARAVTIDEPIKGFRGWRYKWWVVEDEKPLPNWRIP